MNGRDKRRRRAERAKQGVTCPNCLQKGRHYVPPSLGETGFFTCESVYKQLDVRDFELRLNFPDIDYRTVDYRGRGA